MKRSFSILLLVCAASAAMLGQAQTSPQAPPPSPNAAPAVPLDDNGRKAKALVDQAIQALGGQAWLTIRNREQQGRGYAFHHGRPSGSGNVFWSFWQFPDKERVEITKQR